MKRLQLSTWLLLCFSGILIAQSNKKTQNIFLEKDASRHPIQIEGERQRIEVCNLKMDKSYQIIVTIPNSFECTLDFTGNLPFDRDKRLPMITISPKDACYSFELITDCQSLPSDAVLSVVCTDCSKKETPKSLAPIQVSSNSNPFYLIQDVFIGGGCFDVTGATRRGDQDQTGTFTSGTTSIGIEDGIILSSGSVFNASGPNNLPSTSTGYGNVLNDPDLVAISNGNTIYDVASIEFTFTPTIPTISFQYAFASEEYCEYANSSFNDVFGFFISGPGINGPYSNNAENIAQLPGGAGPVSISNVNHEDNALFYIDNVPLGVSTVCNSDPGAAENDIEYDGFTSVLTAVANVIPCQTYRIKLIVADVSDPIYDSAVFLKANSFNAGDAATTSVSISNVGPAPNAPYEGCSDAYFTFERVGDDLSQPYVVPFTISPLSTATAGIDYATLPTAVIIPAGQSSFTLLVDVFEDFIFEGVETIILELNNPCSCNADNSTIEITDPPPLDVVMDDITACNGEEVSLTPQVIGGVPGYTYQWSNGSTNPSLVVEPIGLQNFALTVFDHCGQSAFTTFSVFGSQPTASLSGTDAICQGNFDAALQIEFTGIGPYDITYSIDGNFYETISGIYGNSFDLPVSIPGTYELVAVSAFGCAGEASGTGQVIIDEVLVEIDSTSISCFGANDGIINLEVAGGLAPYSYNWNQGLSDQEDQEGLTAGAYAFTVTDANGCSGTGSTTIEEPPELAITINEIENLDCQNLDNGSIEVEISGGMANYELTWSNDETSTSIDQLDAGIYHLTVTDANNCQVTASATVENDIVYPNAHAQVTDILDCSNSTVTIDASSSSSGPDFSYEWIRPDGTILSDTTSLSLLADSPGMYQLSVINTNNHCVSTTNVEVMENHSLPAAHAGNPDTLTCAIPTLTLNGGESAQGNEFEYQWATSDGHINSGAQSLFPQIDQGGQYILRVTNTQNNCTSLDTVIVAENQLLPTTVINSPGIINCYHSNVEISSQGSDSGDQYTYSWSTTDGNINSNPNEAHILVDAPGNYQLSIINQNNGCSNSAETTITENIAIPEVDAGPDQELDCITSSTILDGGNSSTNGNFQYQWTTDTGSIMGSADEIDITVDAAGIYTLTVINLENGCADSASVFISENSDAPVINVSTEGVLNCSVTEILLDGTGSAFGNDYELQWSSQEGHPIQYDNQLQAIVDSPGTYTLSITDQNSGCTSSSSLVVSQDVVNPQVDAGVGFTLTCSEPAYMLDGSQSDQGNPFVIEWTGPDPSLDFGPNTPTQIIQTGGTYYLHVLNTVNGCTSQDSVQIFVDQTYPVADAGPDLRLTCAYPELAILADGSSNGTSFSINWNTIEGTTQIPVGDLMPLVQNAGTFELLIVDNSNGCTAQDTVVVEEDLGIPNVIISSAPILNCVDTMLNLDASLSSQGTPFLYQWETNDGHILQGENTLTPMIDAPGIYELMILNTENQCINSGIIAINEDISIPTADAGPDFTLTCTQPEIALQGNNSSQGSEYEYEWSSQDATFSNGQDGLNPDVNEQGNYQLLVRNIINGCIATDEVLIQVDQEFPVAQAGPDWILNCISSSVQLETSGTSTGQDYELIWHTLAGPDLPVSNAPSPIVENAGLYELEITNTANGCVSKDTVEVSENFLTPVADAGPEQTLTCTDTLLTLNAELSSQGNEFIYAWSTPDGHIRSGFDSLLPQIDAAGQYQLIITHEESFCRDTSSVFIQQDINQPMASIDAPDTLTCENGSVNLDGSASSSGDHFSYLWSSDYGNIIGSINEMIIVADLPGQYQLEVTNHDNGCKSNTIIQVEEDRAFPIADAGPDGRLTCVVHSASLNGTQSTIGDQIVYRWTSLAEQPISEADEVVATVDTPGAYELTVLNLNNQCASFDTVVVSIDTLAPIANAGWNDTLTCTTTQLTLDGTHSSIGSDFMYQWTSPDNQPIINAQTLEPQIVEAGTYQLLVQNTDNGCTADGEVLISIDTLAPNLLIDTPEILTCAVTNIHLSASATGNHPLSYFWTTSNGLIQTGSQSLSPVVADAGLYQLTATNQGNGCIAVASIPVEIDTLAPVASAGMAPSLNCTTNSVQLDGTGSSQGNYSYQWTGPANAILNGATSLFPTISSPGVYSILVQNLENGCSQIDELEVLLNDVVPVGGIVPPEELNCERLSITLQGYSDETSIPYDYRWEDQDGNILGLDSPLSIDVNEPGIYGFFVHNLENNCQDSTFVTVNQDIEIPVAEAGESAILTCVETTATLNGTQSSMGSHFTYEWTTSNGQILSGFNSLNPEVNREGIYSLFIRNQNNGCTNQDEVEVFEIVPDTATIVKTDPLCHGDFGQLEIVEVEGGFGPHIYSLDGGLHFSTQTYYNTIEPGIYDIVVQDINGCNYEETVEVIEPVDLDINLEANVAIRLGDKYQLEAQVNIPDSEIQSINWSPASGLSCTDCLEPVANPLETTNYELKVVNTNGCEDVAKLYLSVDRNAPIYVPNAFSPYNGDNTNDLFVIYAKEDAINKVNSLIIFNRWGEMVYQVYDFPPNDPRYGWNGLHRGQKMNPGVFVYWAEVELIDGTKVLLKGDVSLID